MTFTPHLAIIGYASQLAQPLPREVLEPLLSRWRVANAQRGVTGLLLLHGDACFGVLEGFPDLVDQLYATVAADPRHRRVTKLVHRQSDRRAFGDWSLGLARATRADVATIPGLAALAAPGAQYTALDWAQAEALVEAFSEGSWRRTIG